jgi:hypothetical protein
MTRKMKTKLIEILGWEHLPCVHKALGLIPSTSKQQNRTELKETKPQLETDTWACRDTFFKAKYVLFY